MFQLVSHQQSGCLCSGGAALGGEIHPVVFPDSVHDARATGPLEGRVCVLADVEGVLIAEDIGVLAYAEIVDLVLGVVANCSRVMGSFAMVPSEMPFSMAHCCPALYQTSPSASTSSRRASMVQIMTRLVVPLGENRHSVVLVPALASKEGETMKSTMELLRDLRIDHDLTQKDIAKVLGISQQHYSKYENGENDLPLHHFSTLAEYYRVSADYLLGRCTFHAKKELDTVYATKDRSVAAFI